MSSETLSRTTAIALLCALSVGAHAGCSSAASLARPAAAARFYLEAAGGPAAEVVLPGTGVPIAIAPKPVFTEFDVVDVQIAEVDPGRCLLFQFTPAAAHDLQRLTRVHPGRRLVLLVDGEPLGSWRIEQPRRGGTLLVFVEAPDEDLAELVERIRAMSAELRRKARRP